MQAPHRYPAGVQSFERIRSQGYLYVDKTAYLHEMLTTGGIYYFLSRPRRFGKTLLVSTMEAYFQGRRDLFEGLAIAQHEQSWQPRPVLRFDLSSIKATDEQTLAVDLDKVLRRMEATYGSDETELSWSSRVEGLITRAAACYKGDDSDRGAVLLIDEYDAPLLNVMHDPAKLQRFREIMREFYAPLKACEPSLRFVFITGISKFSQFSIFSELNNLTNISMVEKYAGICGVTQQELDKALSVDVAYLAERLGTTAKDCRAQLKEMYDGYRFCEGSPEIYNPFSLVSAMANEQIDSYWFGSGTPTALASMLQSSDMELPQLEGVRATKRAFDAPTEAMGNPVAFLYQSGYLTIKSYQPKTKAYILGVPNKEVSEGLYETLLPAYTGTDDLVSGGLVADISEALLLESDLEKALRLLRSFLAGIPYDMAPKNEKAFQGMLFLVFRLVGSNLNAEVRTATGRIDVVMETPDTLYVIELKYRKLGMTEPTARIAIEQIDDKGYLIPYETTSKRLVKAGVVYDEAIRTLDDGWIIEEA